MDEKPITLYTFCVIILVNTATLRFYLAWWTLYMANQASA